MNNDKEPTRTAVTSRGRWICGILLVTVMSLSIQFRARAAATTARPNFIFVLLDDMGYGDMSCYGGKEGATVHLDRLASEGIRFTQFYVASPICSPSRTAFTTGQYPARWRITSYLDNRAKNRERGMAQWLEPSAPTLARALHEAGYATGHFGKWHMGGQRDVGDAPLITEYGFDQTLTQFEGLGDRILPLLDAFDGTPAKPYALGSDRLGRGNITWMDRSRVTSAFVDRTLKFIKEQQAAGRPFYVNVWPDDVHSPFFPPKARRGDGSKRELYLGVTRAMDDQFEPLFDYVRNDPKLRTNTLIVVASDNGPEPGAGSAGPFRGHKGNLYEGGTREPFIVWAPGFMPRDRQGSVNERTVISAVDLLPSLLSLAGVSKPSGVEFDGEDLGEALIGRASPTRSKPLFWVRPPDRPGTRADRFPDLALREGDWKLLCGYDGSTLRLYNLAQDPGEAHNLAGEQPGLCARLKKELIEWYATVPHDNGAKLEAPNGSP